MSNSALGIPELDDDYVNFEKQIVTDMQGKYRWEVLYDPKSTLLRDATGEGAEELRSLYDASATGLRQATRPDGTLYNSGGFRNNLILDSGLDKLSCMAAGQVSQWCEAGTGKQDPRDGSNITQPTMECDTNSRVFVITNDADIQNIIEGTDTKVGLPSDGSIEWSYDPSKVSCLIVLKNFREVTRNDEGALIYWRGEERTVDLLTRDEYNDKKSSGTEVDYAQVKIKHINTFDSIKSYNGDTYQVVVGDNNHINYRSPVNHTTGTRGEDFWDMDVLNPDAYGFELHHVQQTELQNPYKMAQFYVEGRDDETGSIFCGTDFHKDSNGNITSVELVRTYDFYMELTPVTYRELGFMESPAAVSLFSRIVLDEEIHLHAGQFLRVSYHLFVNLDPSEDTTDVNADQSDGGLSADWGGKVIDIDSVGWRNDTTGNTGVSGMLQGREKLQRLGIAAIMDNGVCEPYDESGLSNEIFAPGTFHLGPGYGYTNRWKTGTATVQHPADPGVESSVLSPANNSEITASQGFRQDVGFNFDYSTTQGDLFALAPEDIEPTDPYNKHTVVNFDPLDTGVYYAYNLQTFYSVQYNSYVSSTGKNPAYRFNVAIDNSSGKIAGFGTSSTNYRFAGVENGTPYHVVQVPFNQTTYKTTDIWPTVPYVGVQTEFVVADLTLPIQIVPELRSKLSYHSSYWGHQRKMPTANELDDGGTWGATTSAIWHDVLREDANNALLWDPTNSSSHLNQVAQFQENPNPTINDIPYYWLGAAFIDQDSPYHSSNSHYGILKHNQASYQETSRIWHVDINLFNLTMKKADGTDQKATGNPVPATTSGSAAGNRTHTGTGNVSKTNASGATWEKVGRGIYGKAKPTLRAVLKRHKTPAAGTTKNRTQRDKRGMYSIDNTDFNDSGRASNPLVFGPDKYFGIETEINPTTGKVTRPYGGDPTEGIVHYDVSTGFEDAPTVEEIDISDILKFEIVVHTDGTCTITNTVMETQLFDSEEATRNGQPEKTIYPGDELVLVFENFIAMGKEAITGPVWEYDQPDQNPHIIGGNTFNPPYLRPIYQKSPVRNYIPRLYLDPPPEPPLWTSKTGTDPTSQNGPGADYSNDIVYRNSKLTPWTALSGNNPQGFGTKKSSGNEYMQWPRGYTSEIEALFNSDDKFYVGDKGAFEQLYPADKTKKGYKNPFLPDNFEEWWDGWGNITNYAEVLFKYPGAKTELVYHTDGSVLNFNPDPELTPGGTPLSLDASILSGSDKQYYSFFDNDVVTYWGEALSVGVWGDSANVTYKYMGSIISELWPDGGSTKVTRSHKIGDLEVAGALISKPCLNSISFQLESGSEHISQFMEPVIKYDPNNIGPRGTLWDPVACDPSFVPQPVQDKISAVEDLEFIIDNTLRSGDFGNDHQIHISIDANDDSVMYIHVSANDPSFDLTNDIFPTMPFDPNPLDQIGRSQYERVTDQDTVQLDSILRYQVALSGVPGCNPQYVENAIYSSGETIQDANTFTILDASRDTLKVSTDPLLNHQGKIDPIYKNTDWVYTTATGELTGSLQQQVRPTPDPTDPTTATSPFQAAGSSRYNDNGDEIQGWQTPEGLKLERVVDSRAHYNAQSTNIIYWPNWENPSDASLSNHPYNRTDSSGKVYHPITRLGGAPVGGASAFISNVGAVDVNDVQYDNTTVPALSARKFKPTGTSIDRSGREFPLGSTKALVDWNQGSDSNPGLTDWDTVQADLSGASFETPLINSVYKAGSCTLTKFAQFESNFANRPDWSVIGIGPTSTDPTQDPRLMKNAARWASYTVLLEEPEEKLDTHVLRTYFKYTWDRDLTR